MVKRHLLAAAMIVVAWAGVARADSPIPDDVRRSISSGVDHGDGGGTLSGRTMGAIAAALVGVVLVAVVVNQRQARRDAGGWATAPTPAAGGAAPGTLHHPGKLVRELMRETGLTKAQLRQLEAANDRLAEDGKSVEYPLTLLLCPSLLAAAKDRSAA